MAGQLRIVRIGTNADGTASTPLGTVLETNGDAALFADPSYSGRGPAGIVLGGGLTPIGVPAHSTAVTTSVGGNYATDQYNPGIVYTGTYIYGIVLSDPATQNPATVAATGYITNQTTNYNGDAIYGAPGYPWTVTNMGTVKSTSNGVELSSGGTVNNFGTIDSGVGYPISGIVISGGSGTVTNFGTIVSGEYGIKLTAGGTVTNAQYGWIQGDYPAAVALWGSGTVTNFGTIYGTYWDGVELGAGGSVINFGTIYGPHAAVEYLGPLAAR